MKISRRTLMKTLGAFAALPIGRMLQSSITHAAGSPLPLKFIGIFHPHGLSTQCYNLRDGETETSFDLGFTDSSLMPFAPFKSNLITFEGVDLAVGAASSTTGHGAAITLLTGSTGTGTDHGPQCESLDYFLGRTKGFGIGTSYPTLNLGVGNDGSGNAEAIAWGPGGGRIRNLIDPYKVFDMVFKNVSGATDGGVTAARVRGQSVLDCVKGDLNSLSNRLASAEKAKLDQHLSALRDIESRLNAGSGSMGSCAVPAAPSSADIPKTCNSNPCVAKWNGGDLYFDKIADVQIDLLAQAIICDATRFATFLMDDPGAVAQMDGVAFPMSGSPAVVDAHNGIAHTYSKGTKANGPCENTQQRVLGRLNRYYYSKVARLMQKLKDGGMLNSTLILAGSDMSDPAAHSSLNIPLILAGGVSDSAAAGRLSFGRRIKAPADCPPGNPWCANPLPTYPTPHNRVLVSICKLFDSSVEKVGYGDNSLISGAYAGLLSS